MNFRMDSALERHWQTAAGIACGIGLGCAIGLARNAPVKYMVPLFAGLLFLLALAVFRRAERLCLLALMGTIPFPMHAFLARLDPIHGGGALGIYIMAADLPLFLLYLRWFFDWVRGVPGERDRSSKYIFYFLPFLLFAGISTAWSKEPFWAVCEWLRWLKVLLILIYAARRLKREDLPVCVWGLMASTGFESLLAVLQAVKRSNLGLEKLGVFGAGGEQAVTQDLASGTHLFRGTALTGHPNFLATYLLLSIPMFALLGLVEKRPWHRALYYAGFLAGVGGLGSTMSRAAWVSFAAAGALAFVMAIAQSLLSVKRATIVVLVMLALTGVLGLSASDLIRERFKSDWSESWKLRVELNQAAIAMAQDNLVGGVGLNNYTAEFPHYNPSMATMMLKIDDMYTVVHNVYLLIWAELGTIGLAAFAAFFLAVFASGAGALGRLAPRDRALTLGILSGIFGAMLFDLTEFSLWMEIGMYSLAFWVGALEPISASKARAHTIILPRWRQARVSSGARRFRAHRI